MEGLDLPGLDDVGVVAQPVEELGPVGLGIDGLQLVALDEGVAPVPSATGCWSAPPVPSQTPAIGLSGPRLDSVSGSPSGSV